MMEGPHTNQASVAVALGLGPPRLSRILANRIPVGARTVAIVSSNLDRSSAAILLQAYLRDEVDKVRRIQKELEASTDWGESDLVRIVRTEV
jgi:plasmid maintenance system antidote protein VapI